MLFNLFGVCWVFCIFHPFLKAIGHIVTAFGFPNPVTTSFDTPQTREALVASLPFVVATLHSLFNVINTMILIWFVPQMEKLVTRMVPTPKGEEKEVYRLKFIRSGTMGTAELSINEAMHEIIHFGEICHQGFRYVRQAVNEQNPDKYDEINDKLVKYEEITDNVEFEIASYLNEVTKGEISVASASRVKCLYKIIGEMESLGDSGEAIGRMLKRTHAHGKTFDEQMLRKLNKMMDLVDGAFEAMLSNLRTQSIRGLDITNAKDAEYNINEYRNYLREEHIVNIEKDNYQYQTGVFYMDIVNELEKIGDFIINISEALEAENDQD